MSTAVDSPSSSSSFSSSSFSSSSFSSSSSSNSSSSSSPSSRPADCHSVSTDSVDRPDPVSPPFLFLKDKEDSVIFKILSIIPVFGGIFQALALADIAKKIKLIQDLPNKTQKDTDHAIKLLRSARDYQAIALARDVITLAGVIAIFALGILPLTFFVLGCIAYGGQLIFQAHGLYIKNKMIKDLQDNNLSTAIPQTT